MTDRRNAVYEKVMRQVKIDPVTGCWIWQAGSSGNGRGGGYPRMTLSGQTVAVHRVMYTHFYGYIPGKKQIDHKCSNRMCVSPLHLELVIPKENARRRNDKQRL